MQLNPWMLTFSLCYHQSRRLPRRSSPVPVLPFARVTPQQDFEGVCDQREYLTPEDICALSLMSLPQQPGSSARGCSVPFPWPHPCHPCFLPSLMCSEAPQLSSVLCLLPALLSCPLFLGMHTMKSLSKQHGDAPLSLEVRFHLEEDFCSSVSRSSSSLDFSTGPRIYWYVSPPRLSPPPPPSFSCLHFHPL